MNAVSRLQRLFRIGVAVAVVLLVAAAALIVARETQFDQLRVEYEAAREAAVLLEQFVESGSVPALPPSVAGFGLYGAAGNAIVYAGSAPRDIRPPREGDLLNRDGGTLRLIRPVGGDRRPDPMGRGFVPPAETMQRGMRAGPLASTQFVLIDYDPRVATRQGIWQRAALAGSGILTAAVLAIVVVLYRRLQGATRAAGEQARLAQLGEAARTLAHEIKNPLTAAQMQTALLRRTIAREHHSRIDVLDEELARIRNLTDQVREFIRTGTGSPEPLAALPEIRSIAERLSIPVATDGSDGARVLFDRDRFHSVVGNLLRNAREADPDGEAVEVEVRTRRGRVVIRIADHGPGIPRDERDRVFEPFYTTKTQGSGVGLAITRRFVEDADGSLAVEETEGGGATVVLNLKGADE